ncbi:ExeM/NucH family extracellular endonuclease [Corynebacterium sp. YSMAA1_1_F7]|uniref:ExeM/NucH family extracellular endonuclease n=2 Tax=Corynebacterium TaxID=1716 RepID=UPI0038D1C103
MKDRFKNITSVATFSALALSVNVLTVPTAVATPAGDNVVISAVYGGGGNKGATLKNDYVQLFNPTDKPISLDGWTVQYLSAKGNNNGKPIALSGTIQPKSFYLIKGAAGNGGTQDFVSDATGDNLDLSGSNGTVVLTNSSEKWAAGNPAIDVVGYGNAPVNETAGTAALSNTTAAARSEDGNDTDDNSADFTLGKPAPKYSGGDALDPNAEDPDNPEQPENPDDPNEPEQPGEAEEHKISEIQGTGAVSPLVDKEVKTAGWVTASYPSGGFDGFTIQEGGTANLHKPGEASQAVFVYTGKNGTPADLGKCVVVTGKVGEHADSTQIGYAKYTESTNPAEDCGEKPEPITDAVPLDEETREANEHMMFQPSETYTVTNNYELNQYGSVDLVAGNEPLYQATSVVAPGAEAQAYEAGNAKKIVTLDDGATFNYFRNKDAQNTPQPYLKTAEGIKSLRAGDQVTFANPTVLSYGFEKWLLQPTSQITGDTAQKDLPISWEDSRPAEENGPEEVGGSHSIASFNVLNYFTDLGQDESGCGAYKDREGNPISANRCNVRGAYTEEAFEDQQEKIVKAINTLDVSVLGLEEIENSSKFEQDRDAALKHLVDELNAAGGNWKYVPSPATVAKNEDVIRTAFIYQPEKVEPVGESKILDVEAFDGIARQPLAQQFKNKGAKDEQAFVAVVNHYKSKGSVARDDADTGDGQGNNAKLRAEMSRQLVKWLNEDADFKDKPQFILGDFNAYAKEDAIRIIEEAGYTNLEDKFDAGQSYQFGGRLGSLDHVLANEKATQMATGADVWDINADESVAFEYSRRNYNAVDFYEPNVFRASDHDPIKVGFNAPGAEPKPAPGPGEPNDPNQPGGSTGSLGGSKTELSGSAKAGIITTIILGILALGVGGAGLWGWVNNLIPASAVPDWLRPFLPPQR